MRTIMNLPTLLQQLESGSISAAQAEQEIRDEIERIYSHPHYGNREFEQNAKIGWMGGLSVLKAAFGLLTEIEK